MECSAHSGDGVDGVFRAVADAHVAACVDIGTWASHCGSAGVELLRSPTALAVAGGAEARAVMASLGLRAGKLGSQSGVVFSWRAKASRAGAPSFIARHHLRAEADASLLDASQREALMRHADAAAERDAGSGGRELSDFKLELSLAQLGAVVSQPAVRRLVQFFGRPPNAVTLRRAAAAGAAEGASPSAAARIVLTRVWPFQKPTGE